jgi:spermidine/putrescine-binding protein
MGTKRLAILGVVLAAVIGGLFLMRGKTEDTTLRVCTWSNYLPESLLQNFTKQTGIKVELSYMSSNEELLAKLKAGASGYDIIQPSDYMVRQMVQIGMIQPLEHKRLTNIGHLDEFYRNLPYDPGMAHSVPLTWGTTGIAVNTAKVKAPETVTWKWLLETADPRHTSLLDDMRETFASVFLSRGLTINEKGESSLAAARDEIARVKGKILMFTSEPKPLLQKEELYVAHIYSTDGIALQAENPAIRYFIPAEGATLWTDNLAIPTTSKKSEAAHAFMDFLLNPENAMVLVETNHLATPNKTVKARLKPEELNDPNQYPPADVMKRLQFLEDIGDTMNVVSRMWTELKS